MVQKIKCNGEIVNVQAQKIKGKFWIHFKGQTIVIDPEADKKKRSGIKSSANAGDLVAPMPGKITKIHKSVGDKVEKGDAIIVMEAMKMEYTLKSDVTGVVKSIHCKVSDQVALGKTIVIVG